MTKLQQAIDAICQTLSDEDLLTCNNCRRRARVLAAVQPLIAEREGLLRRAAKACRLGASYRGMEKLADEIETLFGGS